MISLPKHSRGVEYREHKTILDGYHGMMKEGGDPRGLTTVYTWSVTTAS